MRRTKCDTCGGSGAVDNDSDEDPTPMQVQSTRRSQCPDCLGTGHDLSHFADEERPRRVRGEL
jgi:DnaJ-class molecular chaperone